MLLRFHQWAGEVLRIQDEWGRESPLVKLLQYRSTAWWKEAQEKYKLRKNFRSPITAGLRHASAGALPGWEAPLATILGANWRELARDASTWWMTRERFVAETCERWHIKVTELREEKRERGRRAVEQSEAAARATRSMESRTSTIASNKKYGYNPSNTADAFF